MFAYVLVGVIPRLWPYRRKKADILATIASYRDRSNGTFRTNRDHNERQPYRFAPKRYSLGMTFAYRMLCLQPVRRCSGG